MRAAFGKKWEGKGGVYVENCQEAGLIPEGGTLAVGVAPDAFDPEGEKKFVGFISLNVELVRVGVGRRRHIYPCCRG